MKNGFIAFIVIFLFIFLLLGSCDSGSSSSGRKWSDLSDQEKANAKWAYNVQQYING